MDYSEIEVLRTAEGLSQETLADILGMHQSYIQKLEKKKVLSIKNLKKRAALHEWMGRVKAKYRMRQFRARRRRLRSRRAS